ncbi:MAG: hypothetical protein NC429_00985 [Lachnospiraceae bacterium]|nr:hypothetical protein [Lachnospiraceae bacterium]
MKSKDNNFLYNIEKFYTGELKSNQIIPIEKTPKYLQILGVPPLPIIIKQSTLAKCIRTAKGSRSAHNLDRKMIETLPEQIRNPILVVEEKERNSLALITDYKDQNGLNMLVALKININIQNMPANEVVSFYGRNNLGIYIGKHAKADIHIVDKNKAKQLTSLLRLQLPTTLQVLDYTNKLSQGQLKVNKNFQKVRQEARMPDNNFQFFGKEKMIALMKSQFGYTADKDAKEFEFKYTKLGDTSERLEYLNDYYDDHHDLYHSIVAGEEVCLYHVNDGRNRRVEIPGRNAAEQKASVIDKLNRFSQDINSDKDKPQIPRGNNLEHQPPHQER